MAYDPDTWLLYLRTPDAIKKWLLSEKDYLTDYLPAVLQARGTGPKAVADAITQMGLKVELIEDDMLRKSYYDHISDYWPAFKKNYKLKKREINAPLPELEKLKKDVKEAFFKDMFWEEGGAYWTMNNNQGKFRMCTFTMEVLFFVRTNNEPKYVCSLRNIYGQSSIAAISTDDFVTLGTFKKSIERLGPGFIFEGSEVHLTKLKLKLFYGVKIADEPRFMGYNHAGFYTWANGLFFDGSFYKSNKYGIVQLRHRIDTMDDFKELAPQTHVIFGDDEFVVDSPEKFFELNPEETVSSYISNGKVSKLSFYFLPFSTRIRVGQDEDDAFEFEKKFRYFEPDAKDPEPSFSHWAKLMRAVYHDNGVVAIAYYLMSLFRDIVYKGNNNYIPLLGFFGPRQSGKSTCARSINKMFGEGLKDGVNLESGSTATGIRRYMASMQNAILWLNEYKNSLPEYTLGMIKGISDGSGKITGRNTSGNETKNYEPRCAVVLCGQDMPTKDPAILSRSIVCEFEAKNRDRDKLDELIGMENRGAGTVITCHLLSHRDRMKELYKKWEPYVTKYIRSEAKKKEIDADDRIILNVTSLLTTCLIISNPKVTSEHEPESLEELMPLLINSTEREDDGEDLGFSLSHLANILIEKLRMQVEIQHTSDDVEQYFQVLMSLASKGLIRDGEHYMIKRGTDGTATLYLRTRYIHGLYRQAAQQQNMAVMDASTLTTYITKHKAYKGYEPKGVKFDHEPNKTSATLMNYDLLRSYGIELKMSKEIESMPPALGVNDEPEFLKG